VDKIKIKNSESYISPYLRRPLRSLADALAERNAASSPAKQANRLPATVEIRRGPDFFKGLSV
jgi:hypothetical protein